MKNHTQTPSVYDKSGAYQNLINAESSSQASKAQKLQSVFNLVKSKKGKKAVICQALTGE